MRVEAALVGAALLVTALAGGADGTPALQVDLSAEELRVGDHLALTVSARGADGLLWGEPEVATDAGGPWAVVDGPHAVAGASPPVWELVIAPLEVGELELPPLTVAVRGPDGEPRPLSAAPGTVVEVSSVLPADGEPQPLPMRAPLGVAGFPWEYVLPVAVPILLLAAAGAGWLRRRRRVQGEDAAPDLPPLAELERLLQRLEQRLGRDPADGTCDRLAAGLRRFLARQTNEPAEDMTSFELRLLARRLGWPEPVQRGVQEVMGLADRVRFGRAATDTATLQGALETARDTARRIENLLDESSREAAAG